MSNTYALIKRDGQKLWYTHTVLKNLIRDSSNRVLYGMSNTEIEAAEDRFYHLLTKYGESPVPYEIWRKFIAEALQDYPEVQNAFLAVHKREDAQHFSEICTEMNNITTIGDQSTGSVDSSLCSSKRALIVDAVEKITYRNYHLTAEQKEAFETGYIYIHDMGHRRDSINCCLFDMKTVLAGGFEMGEMWYDEPSCLREAFDTIASVSLNAAAQIYGGFTIPQIDELLAIYAYKSFSSYTQEFTDKGISQETAENLAMERIAEDFEIGFDSFEKKFNSIISPRGDYPFITISFGIGTDRFAQMATLAALRIRKNGHGPRFHKRPVLFPKLVFLYDKNLHQKGGELYHLFHTAIECSSQVMYPEYLSLTGDLGIVSQVYKKYGKVISPMCCRAFLSEWFEHGGEKPLDDKDQPVFVGRFNYGVVSLNLPMILAKSRAEKTDFHHELDHYLELARQIHITTYRFLSRKKAHTNPLAFMQGGLYGGHLDRDDTIEPLLKSATASFGFTALHELQMLYNGKSLVEDGEFALNTLKYINSKVAAMQKEDHLQYTVYGTPAETLCGRQAEQFRKKFGLIDGVSNKEYFSNSFHCHVSEDISPIQKQDYESRFWDYANGGKIQYIRFTDFYNIEALEAIVSHAMDLGLYEGINMSLAYCNNCGYEWKNRLQDRPDECPKCHSGELTMIERMCGYLAYTRLHGQSRLNHAKMAEIADRISM